MIGGKGMCAATNTKYPMQHSNRLYDRFHEFLLDCGW